MGQKKYRLVGSRITLAFYLLISIAILLLGTFAYLRQKKILKTNINNELESVALLKANEIHTWLKERMTDANVFTQSPIFSKYFQQLLKNRNSLSFNIINDKIHLLKIQYEYEEVLIVDRSGNIILSTGQNTIHQCNDFKLFFNKALDAGQTVITDFSRCEQDLKIYLDFITPIYHATTNNKKENIGFLVLRCNPHSYLYPLINKWPTNSKTAETLLARRDGDSVLFINDIRHSRNSALKLRISLTKTNVPAVRGALGFYGLYEGVDYRKKKVLSYILQIPETNWFMVSKVDTSEIHQPLRNQTWIFSIVLMLVLALIGLILKVVQSSIQKNIYKKSLELKVERKALISHFEYLFKYANDIITLLDKDLKIVEVNEKALAAYGYTRNEMIGMDGKLLRSSVEQVFLKNMDTIQNKGSLLYETVNQRKDGSEFPVEVSARSIEIDDHRYYQFIARDITERKQVEKALSISEEKFRSIFENMSAACCFDEIIYKNGIAIDYRILDVNHTYEKILGISKNDVIGKLASEIYKSDKIPFFDIYLRVAETGNAEEFESYFAPAGVYLHINASRPAPGMFSTVFYNITERKKNEVLLKESITKYQILFDSFPLGITISDKNGNIVESNQKALKLLGQSEQEHLSRNIESEEWHIVKIDGSPLPKEEFASVIALKENRLVENVEMGIVKGENEIVWINVTAVPINIEKLGVIITYNDISERINAEKALKENKAKLDVALSSMTDAIFISNTKGEFIEFNDAFATFHRFKNKDECLKSLIEYPDILEVFMANGELAPLDMWAVPRALRGEIVTNAEYTIRRKDTGEKWVGSYSFSPIRDQKGEIIGSVVVSRDITEIKQSEEKILSQLNELQRWQKVTIGREDRTRELKQEVNELLIRLGEAIRYPSQKGKT